MKPYLYLSIFIISILASCENSQKKEIIKVESVEWKLDEINVLDTTTSNFVPYFQQTDTAGNNGFVEFKDYGIRGQE